MEDTQFLLIGGGLAANTAAKAIRKADTDSTITLVSEEAHPPYNRPPLSKQFLLGTMPKERLFFDKPEVYNDQRIDLRLNSQVASVDAGRKTVRLENGDEIHFEKALIATGGSPIIPPIPGVDAGGVFTLRNLGDTEAIAKAAESAAIAVIIGGGFIGLEAAAALSQLNVRVHVVELQDRIWQHFAPQALSEYIQDYCRERGVVFHLETGAEAIVSEDGMVTDVVLSNGDELHCDMVCIGVGIRPNTGLAADAGLDVDDGIIVNENLQSSHSDIYAAGDVANFIDAASGRRRRVEHWGHARFSGDCAGKNMAGDTTTYDALPYVWSDIFDLKLNFAGDEHGCDRILTRGKIEDGVFSLLFMKGSRMSGCFLVNVKGAEFGVMKQLIQGAVDLSASTDALTDPAADLKPLLQ